MKTKTIAKSLLEMEGSELPRLVIGALSVEKLLRSDNVI